MYYVPPLIFTLIFMIAIKAQSKVIKNNKTIWNTSHGASESQSTYLVTST